MAGSVHAADDSRRPSQGCGRTEVVWQGTVDAAAKLHYPLAHNHPSGVAEPSQADIAITRALGQALELVGVRVLDHLVIGEGEPVSMAQRGLV